MYTVTNRFKIVKGGTAEKMAPVFVRRDGLEEFNGFRGIQITVSTQFEDFDEMNVMMYWESKEDFDVWHESDHFKKSHNRDKNKVQNDESKRQSPILSNEVIYANVAAELVIS